MTIATKKIRKKKVANEVGIALGVRLKECRHAAELSQEKLAFAAQVDRTFISACERGLGNPSVETLANIAFCLNITLAELFATVEVSLKPSGMRRMNVATPPEILRKRLR